MLAIRFDCATTLRRLLCSESAIDWNEPLMPGGCMEWTIQDLGAIGEFVGAIGVVPTLIYLAYQIRQNTFQLEQNTLTARAAAFRNEVDRILK